MTIIHGVDRSESREDEKGETNIPVFSLTGVLYF
jgi:hypothetical protein